MRSVGVAAARHRLDILSGRPIHPLAGQFVLLGASLDALRAFYSRALNLLDPATALSLVSAECRRLGR